MHAKKLTWVCADFRFCTLSGDLFSRIFCALFQYRLRLNLPFLSLNANQSVLVRRGFPFFGNCILPFAVMVHRFSPLFWVKDFNSVCCSFILLYFFVVVVYFSVLFSVEWKPQARNWKIKTPTSYSRRYN